MHHINNKPHPIAFTTRASSVMYPSRSQRFFHVPLALKVITVILVIFWVHLSLLSLDKFNHDDTFFYNFQLSSIAQILSKKSLSSTFYIKDTWETTMSNHRSISYDFIPFQDRNNSAFTFTIHNFNFFSLVANDAGQTLQDDIFASTSSYDLERFTTTDTDVSSSAHLCHVVCRFPPNSFEVQHFPHFLQQAYPCWSLLQRFRFRAKYFYIAFSDERLAHGRSSYIQSFLDVIQNGSPPISILQWNQKLPNHLHDCNNNAMSILAEKDFHDTGWDSPVKYFMNNADMEQLQRVVLGPKFRHGYSSFASQVHHVLLLNRQSSTREWIFADATKQLLEEEFGNSVIVTHAKSFDRSTLHHQAYTVHSADIIFSPHGAQLANLAYIRPCTVVVEMFPYGYYLHFFQSLVVVGNGVFMEGYPTGGDRVSDTKNSIRNATFRGQSRSVPMLVSPYSVLEALPQILIAAMECRNRIGNMIEL